MAHHWNVEAGPSWVLNEQHLDAMLEPFLARLMDVAQPKTGERGLDIGCGCGATTIALVQAVGPTGAVLGIDLSAPMLDRARDRLDALALQNVKLERATRSRSSCRPCTISPSHGSASCSSMTPSVRWRTSVPGCAIALVSCSCAGNRSLATPG